MRKPNQQIHYYDTDTGYVHYTSDIEGFEGVDCRALDAISKPQHMNETTFQMLSDPPSGQAITNGDRRAFLFERLC